jgi:hypothetical protein
VRKIGLEAVVGLLSDQLVGHRLVEADLRVLLRRAEVEHGERAPYEVAPSVEGLVKTEETIAELVKKLDVAEQDRIRQEGLLKLLWDSATDLDWGIRERETALSGEPAADGPPDPLLAYARLSSLRDELVRGEHDVLEIADAVAESAAAVETFEDVPSTTIGEILERMSRLEELRPRIDALAEIVHRLDAECAKLDVSWP